jgi:hypothetical protein
MTTDEQARHYVDEIVTIYRNQGTDIAEGAYEEAVRDVARATRELQRTND